MMKYQSKKHPEITAVYDFQNPKTKTITMIYLTGEKAGYSFDISPSTLKRWWKKVEISEQELNEERINTPYHPDVTPHYIPKPQSVIDYEEKKLNARKNLELPDFETIVDDLGSILRKANETSKYVMLSNSDTTIWRKSKVIDIYADEETWLKLVDQGLQSSSNKDSKRPYAIKIKTAEEYKKVLDALLV